MAEDLMHKDGFGKPVNIGDSGHVIATVVPIIRGCFVCRLLSLKYQGIHLASLEALVHDLGW